MKNSRNELFLMIWAGLPSNVAPTVFDPDGALETGVGVFGLWPEPMEHNGELVVAWREKRCF